MISCFILHATVRTQFSVFFIRIKKLLIRYKILFSILYWNVNWCQLKFHVITDKFFSVQPVNWDNIGKYFWGVGISFPRKIDKEYGSFGISLILEHV